MAELERRFEMSTATRTPSKPRRKIPVRIPADQLRKDRIMAIIVLVAFAAMIALIMWIASLGGGEIQPLDWPMMPM